MSDNNQLSPVARTAIEIASIMFLGWLAIVLMTLFLGSLEVLPPIGGAFVTVVVVGGLIIVRYKDASYDGKIPTDRISVILFGLMILSIFIEVSLVFLGTFGGLIAYTSYLVDRHNKNRPAPQRRPTPKPDPTSQERRARNVASLKERATKPDEIDYFFEHGHFPEEG